jgi:hypothetical protein
MKLVMVMMLALLTTACASSGRNGDDQQDSVDVKASAKIHTELGAIFFGSG